MFCSNQLVTGLDWTGLDWTGLDWTGLDWTGLDWTGLDWTGLDWTGLDWTGLDWTGLDWTGLDWTGPDWTGLDYPKCLKFSIVYSFSYFYAHQVYEEWRKGYPSKEYTNNDGNSRENEIYFELGFSSTDIFSGTFAGKLLIVLSV